MAKKKVVPEVPLRYRKDILLHTLKRRRDMRQVFQTGKRNPIGKKRGYCQMSRNISGLKAHVRKKLMELKNLAKGQGIEFTVTSTLRTPAEQFAYFSQGRNSLAEVNRLRAEAGLPLITEEENRRIVTHTLNSAHLEGRAFDVAVVKRESGIERETARQVPVWNQKSDLNRNQIPDYLELGKIAESIGLTWGGRFRIRDYVHFELREKEF